MQPAANISINVFGKSQCCDERPATNLDLVQDEVNCRRQTRFTGDSHTSCLRRRCETQWSKARQYSLLFPLPLRYATPVIPRSVKTANDAGS